MSPSPIKKAYIDTSHGQIHYRYVVPAQGAPKKSTTILFLHKSASSSASYISLMTIYASKGYTCYAPDMPGFGSSFDPSPSDIKDIQEQGTKWFIETFIEVFQSLGFFKEGSGKVHILGHHSGAVLAPEIAATYPEYVASICLVGPAVMSAEERAAMKEIYFAPFNQPVADGSHLLKTWTYLSSMGVGDSMELLQREAIDHIRAWKGRNLIYGAVWDQDAERIYAHIKCKIMLMCATDDVLWKYYGHVKDLRPEVQAEEIAGGNFELDRDAEGIEKYWTGFLERVEKA